MVLLYGELDGQKSPDLTRRCWTAQIPRFYKELSNGPPCVGSPLSEISPKKKKLCPQFAKSNLIATKDVVGRSSIVFIAQFLGFDFLE